MFGFSCTTCLELHLTRDHTVALFSPPCSILRRSNTRGRPAQTKRLIPKTSLRGPQMHKDEQTSNRNLRQSPGIPYDELLLGQPAVKVDGQCLRDPRAQHDLTLTDLCLNPLGATYQVARNFALSAAVLWVSKRPIRSPVNKQKWQALSRLPAGGKAVLSSDLGRGYPPPPRIHTVSIRLPQKGALYGQLKGNFPVFEDTKK